jgi:hypothetical protein
MTARHRSTVESEGGGQAMTARHRSTVVGVEAESESSR